MNVAPYLLPISFILIVILNLSHWTVGRVAVFLLRPTYYYCPFEQMSITLLLKHTDLQV